jgi:hypothetical protein
MKKIKTSICEALNEGVDQDDSSKVVILDFLTNVASYQVQPFIFWNIVGKFLHLEFRSSSVPDDRIFKSRPFINQA